MARKAAGVAGTDADKRRNPTGTKSDGTPDKRFAKRGEAGYHERNTAAANAACAKQREERAAAGKGDDICIFPDVAELEIACVGYFDYCDDHGEKYSEAGLCLWLSKHNSGNRNVTLRTLQGWYDGLFAKHLQETVQMAYLRIQHQIETDPRYDDKAMTSYRIFLEKQKRLGGKTDKQEIEHDAKIEVTIKNFDEELAK